MVHPYRMLFLHSAKIHPTVWIPALQLAQHRCAHQCGAKNRWWAPNRLPVSSTGALVDWGNAAGEPLVRIAVRSTPGSEPLFRLELRFVLRAYFSPPPFITNLTLSPLLPSNSKSFPADL
jgi:hypothetical protein